MYLLYRKEEDQLDDLKNVGESNYNPGDGTDQRIQSLVFVMMMYCSYGTYSGSIIFPKIQLSTANLIRTRF